MTGLHFQPHDQPGAQILPWGTLVCCLWGGGQGREGAVDRTLPAHDLSALNSSRIKQAPKSQAALCGPQLSIKCARPLMLHSPQGSNAPYLCPVHSPELPDPP